MVTGQVCKDVRLSLTIELPEINKPMHACINMEAVIVSKEMSSEEVA